MPSTDLALDKGSLNLDADASSSARFMLDDSLFVQWRARCRPTTSRSRSTNASSSA